MGKGLIKSGGLKGEYQVEIKYNRDSYDREIERLDEQISRTQALIADCTDPTKKKIYQLQLVSYQKQKEELTKKVPQDQVISAWCADLTEDLEGEVGTIEVPGEVGNIQIQPGYENNADYDSARDGQLVPSATLPPCGFFYNLAMLPGWQKWKPLFRYGTIANIDGDIADVDLEGTTSSQQGLDINQENSLSDVPIEYMNCNGSAFSAGDEVLIMFPNDWNQPKIIGFKNNPKPCGSYVYIQLQMVTGNIVNDIYCLVWDLELNDYATGIKKNNGEMAIFPLLLDEISDWKNSKTIHQNYVFSYQLNPPRDFSIPSAVTIPVESTRYYDNSTCTPSNLCYSSVGEEAFSFPMQGYDSDGEKADVLFGSHDIKQKYNFGTFYSEYNRAYDYPFDAPGIYSFTITSLTNQAESKGQGAKSETTEYKKDLTCNIGQGWDCPNLAGVNTGCAIDIETQVIDYEIYSPFFDKKNFTLTNENYFEVFWGAENTCETHEKIAYIADQKFGISSCMDDTKMVYIVAEAMKKGELQTTCANYKGTRGQCVNEYASFSCNDTSSVIYKDVIPLTIRTFSLVNENISEVSPFDIPENSKLNSAIIDMKNIAEAESGPPASDKNCVNFSSLIQFLK